MTTDATQPPANTDDEDEEYGYTWPSVSTKQFAMALAVLVAIAALVPMAFNRSPVFTVIPHDSQDTSPLYCHHVATDEIPHVLAKITESTRSLAATHDDHIVVNGHCVVCKQASPDLCMFNPSYEDRLGIMMLTYTDSQGHTLKRAESRKNSPFRRILDRFRTL